MANRPNPAGFRPIRHDRLLQEAVHDTYQTKGKLPEPTVCPDCGAVFHTGRWQWLDKPKDAQQATCPACHRMRDHFPAGFVWLRGDFPATHGQEIMQLIRNRETQEKAEHPMQRIMEISSAEDGIQVTTTDIHLARSIGDAVHHAYQGELKFHYNPEQNLLRVNWSR